MTRNITQLEIDVIKFALNCEGNLERIHIPQPGDQIVDEYDGYRRLIGAASGSHRVGSAAVVTETDHVVIDVFSDDNDKVCEISYVSMLGIDPTRFPLSMSEVSCDINYSPDS